MDGWFFQEKYGDNGVPACKGKLFSKTLQPYNNCHVFRLLFYMAKAIKKIVKAILKIALTIINSREDKQPKQ